MAPLPVVSTELTPAEAEVLGYVQTGHLTNKQIAARRGTNLKGVERIKRQLREKGHLGGVPRWRVGVSPSTPSTNGRIRLHAMQWRVDLVQAGPRYARELVQGSKRSLWGVTVLLHPFYVEFYATPDCVFYGETESAAMSEAISFWDRLARRLENDLDVLLLKDRANNWQLVKAEWATEHSEVGRRAAVDGETWKFYAREDGRLWFSCDASRLNQGAGFEHETHHVRTGKEDSEKVNRVLDEVRGGAPSFNDLAGVLSRLAHFQESQARLNADTAAGLGAVVKVLEMTLKAPELPKEPENAIRRPFYVG